MNQRIAISSGDFNGIGPEVIGKTMQTITLEKVTPIILGSSEVMDCYLDLFSLEMPYYSARSADDIKDGIVNILESYNGESISIQPGAFTRQSGKCSMMAVEKGIQLCMDYQAEALVTAPISKEAVNLAGYSIPGHTEFLAEQTGTENFMMMLVHDNLRVGLATVHIPIVDVPRHLSETIVGKYIDIMHQTLRSDFNIHTPRIAILGLNPHAGDGGVIGTEEKDYIEPVIEKKRGEGLSVSGPHPADGFFGTRKFKDCDGILAMYHDQGLIPFKTLSFGEGVNFTAGLPIIRTSPDHGTAFDIAGKGKASPSSFRAAFVLAMKLAENRKQEAEGI